MRFYWLLPSFLSIFLVSLPANAARLVYWRFDANQNRLDFRTDDGVQPRAQLLANPTRVVIDLPGTSLGRSTVTQQLAGSLRSLRVGQFEGNTTRMVIELDPGYTLDPEKVLVRGASPSQWSVQLPKPERVAQVSNPSPRDLAPRDLDLGNSPPPPLQPLPNQAPRNPSPPPVLSRPPIRQTPPNVTVGSLAQIEDVQVTRDGFFLRTNGGRPQIIKVNRSSDRKNITFDLRGATLSRSLTSPSSTVNRYGVSRILLSQVDTSPSIVRVTMNVRRESPDWLASVSDFGGIVILPKGTSAGDIESPPLAGNQPSPISGGSRPPSTAPSQPVPTNRPNNQLATIQSVELASSGTQLLIRADAAVRYTGRWDAREGVYRITIPSAELADRVRGPQLDATTSVRRVRLQQQDSRTVVILVQPASGVQVGELNQVSDQLLALQLQRSRLGSVVPPTGPIRVPPTGSVNVPPPQNNNPPSRPRPRVGRLVVVVDAGHGGKDPGAIGYRGLREVDVILPIAQQVAALLEQQGIQAVMTRKDDYFVDLQPRVTMAERANADLFVSIHANSIGGRPDVQGLETYYYSSGGRLAQTIHNSILQNVDIRDRGVRQARFYVLRKSSMPAVLVEVGFVSSPQEAVKLASPNYQSQMARAIARGILQYIQQSL
ncbi:N-acetylmuramoyl-L-alanine amidase [Coleofasciculus sp. FACHB-712]|uniref:N-acetylmuramoyl-L-alanine amidase n=1 Tax=Coleofasciculus sp. FACHB-712 TaxID=2692789 RepID=UPI0016880BD9|nr:N-acetylmuramoyl-L-alanine amidase [Coleofasciculus sp. FACHB-712]